MIKKNEKISAWQIFLMGGMIGNSLFVGMGNIITVHNAYQDDWLVALFSLVIGLIPAFLIYKIFDYLPNLNILDKTKQLLGKIGGQIINILLLIIVMVCMWLTFWIVSNFASTKYLTETPLLFIGFLFLIPTIYAAFKGIETISRTIQILFFFSLVIHVIITSSLTQFVNIENIKPILNNGSMPIIRGIIGFLSYILVPFLTLLIIPKDIVVDNKNVKRYFIMGYVVAALFMALVFFMNMSVVGIDIVPLYRFPEYYIIKKVSIGGIFDNVENFLSIHWIFNIFSLMILCMYFIKEYFVTTFRIKKRTTKYLVISIVGLIIIYFSCNVSLISTIIVSFMKNQFPLLVGLSSLLIIVFLNVLIFIKKKKNS